MFADDSCFFKKEAASMAGRPSFINGGHYGRGGARGAGAAEGRGEAARSQHGAAAAPMVLLKKHYLLRN